MKVIRTQPDAGWTPIANAALQDHRISWRAKGLLVELLSYRSGWETTVDKLVATARLSGDASEGFRAMRNAMVELVKAGYVKYERASGPGGKWHTVLVVSDQPTDASKTDTSVTDASETDVSARPGETPTDVSGTDTSVHRHVGNRHIPRKKEKAPAPPPLRGSEAGAGEAAAIQQAFELMRIGTHDLEAAAKAVGISRLTLIRAAKQPH